VITITAGEDFGYVVFCRYDGVGLIGIAGSLVDNSREIVDFIFYRFSDRWNNVDRLTMSRRAIGGRVVIVRRGRACGTKLGSVELSSAEF